MIADKAIMPVARAEAISQSVNWKGIDVDEMERFTKACGIDFTNRRQVRRAEAYMRRRPSWDHLVKSPEWETVYRPLMATLAKANL